MTQSYAVKMTELNLFKHSDTHVASSSSACRQNSLLHFVHIQHFFQPNKSTRAPVSANPKMSPEPPCTSCKTPVWSKHTLRAQWEHLIGSSSWGWLLGHVYRLCAEDSHARPSNPRDLICIFVTCIRWLCPDLCIYSLIYYALFGTKSSSRFVKTWMSGSRSQFKK